VANLCAQVDRPLAALLTDLKQRGLLETTLVIWMGDFGRTPHVGKKGGRDHYPRAWTSVLAGAGLKTGQAVGRTSKDGGDVVDRPISAVDFMATMCKALDIDYTKDFRTRDGRPMRVVDKNEKVVKELFA
jgi:arylsulfatase A-like enzyme